MTEKAKILYIITRADLGGAQSHVKELIDGFHQKYEVHLATGKEGWLTEVVRAMGIKVHLLPCLTRSIDILTDFRAVQECTVLIKKIQPDLIHAHSSKAGIIARISGKISKVPTIFTAHGWAFTPRTPIIQRIIALLSEKFAALLATKLICVSNSDRQLPLDHGVGNSQSLITIRHGISNNSFPVANPSLEPPHIIMVARFNEQKDQTTLLKAISQLPYTDIQIDFVGSGVSLDSCKALAQSLGIVDRVSFLGDRTDVPELLAKAQIFVLSTHYEGLPISILEAMRAGLPIVATSVNGIPEEVTDGKTGLLVPHADVDALVSALKTLIDSPDLRQSMGKAGREKFLQEFTTQIMLAKTEDVYQNTVKRSTFLGNSQITP